MSWESASMPLAAMVGLGRPTSRSGSTTATLGSISGLRRLALTPPPDSTELRVTSEPVPAVVGTATQGRPGVTIGRPAPMTSRCSRGSVPGWPARRQLWQHPARCHRRIRGRHRSLLRPAVPSRRVPARSTVR